MKKNKKVYVIFWISFLLTFSNIYGGHNFKDYTQKAAKHITLLEELYNKYPISGKSQQQSLIKAAKKKWENLILQYKHANGNERNKILLRMKVNYSKLLILLRQVCVKLSKYSDDILIDFTKRGKEHDLNSEQKDIYENSFRVAKHEMYRAHKAFINNQFNYSANLYDRSVIVLANTYKKLKWAVPPTYKKVQTIKTISANSLGKSAP